MTTHDDAFREIQLSGKQLVFLFMAVTVVSVVIFLCGVLVGRGVRAERGLPDAGTETSTVSPAIVEPPLSPASAAAGPATSNALVTAGEKLTYAERLSATDPAAEQLRTAAVPPPVAESAPVANAKNPASSAPARPKTPEAPPPAREAKAAARPTASLAEPPGAGFAIQVAALRERAEADTIVARLTGKGYPAYVVAPAQGAPTVFRVRVGKFKERREADSVAARLQKEEQFKPWVVR
jgi:cell division septation protein DedD